MAEYTIYTRAYSKSSAGRLVSAKGSDGDALSRADLLDEFRNHSKKWSQKPTALVSVSDRIVDTVKRAYDMHYEGGESPADIWIAFIEVPATNDETPTGVHHAKALAKECDHSEPDLLLHEFIFEWAIPGKYVLHQVSLQTLMDRGLQWEKYLVPNSPELMPLSTEDLRSLIAGDLQPTGSWHVSWEIGVKLGCFARTFGATAPFDWIARQLLIDCVSKKKSKKIFDKNKAILSGINTALYEWWIHDIDFVQRCEQFYEWRDAMEQGIVWDLAEFWETWHHLNCDESSSKISEAERLSAKHEKIWAIIDAEAVMIGL